jgi:hypothetical protein
MRYPKDEVLRKEWEARQVDRQKCGLYPSSHNEEERD